MAYAWITGDIWRQSSRPFFGGVFNGCRTSQTTARDAAEHPAGSDPDRATPYCWIEGRPSKIAAAADYLEVPFYEPNASQAITMPGIRYAEPAMILKIRAILRPGPPDG
jgi:hypothetical protein